MSHHMMITQRSTISPPGYAHPEAATLLAVIDRLKDAEIRNRPVLELIMLYHHSDYHLYPMR